MWNVSNAYEDLIDKVISGQVYHYLSIKNVINKTCKLILVIHSGFYEFILNKRMT